MTHSPLQPQSLNQEEEENAGVKPGETAAWETFSWADER